MDTCTAKAYFLTDLYSAISLADEGLAAGTEVAIAPAAYLERANGMLDEGITPVVLVVGTNSGALDTGGNQLMRHVSAYYISVDLAGETTSLKNFLAGNGVYVFRSSEAAYNASQCTEGITGSCLVVPSEQLVGIADTYPIAITENPGDLHVPHPGFNPFEGRKVTDAQIEFAKAVSESLNFPVADWAQQLQPTGPRVTSPRL